VLAREPIEPATKLQKEIEVHLEPTGTRVTVIHRLANHTLFPLEYSVWAMSMMAQNGVAVTGFPPRGKHPANLEATNPLVMWAYTDLSDRRLKLTKKYLSLRQDPAQAEAEKVGLFNPSTWVAYLLNGEAFVKETQADPGKTYPDFGCSFETFTNADFLEIETLGPLTKVPPEKYAEHTEHWSLHRGIQAGDLSDAEIDRMLISLQTPARR
jgi:hypothetical protein